MPPNGPGCLPWSRSPRGTRFRCNSFQVRDSEAVAAELVSDVEQVCVALAFEQVRIAQHVRIPTRDRYVDADARVVPGPLAQVVRPCVAEPVSPFLVHPEIGRSPVAEDHVIPVPDSRHRW